MKFAIAVNGANVSENTDRCDGYIIYEEKHGKVISRQNAEKPQQGSDDLPDFLGRYGIEAILCECIDSAEAILFSRSGIIAETRISGKADKIADVYASRAKREGKKKACLQPRPNVLVSCRGLDGEDNVLAVACACVCSNDPPMVMVGIVPSRYSHHMIKESGCFVVNLVDKSYKEIFDYMGIHSKRDGDKLAEMNVRLQEGKRVNAPTLPDCPVNIECTVVNSIVTGSHEMFVGKVEYVHANSKITDDEGNIDFSQIDFI